MNFSGVDYVRPRSGRCFFVAKRATKSFVRRVLNKQDEGLFRKSKQCCDMLRWHVAIVWQELKRKTTHFLFLGRFLALFALFFDLGLALRRAGTRLSWLCSFFFRSTQHSTNPPVSQIYKNQQINKQVTKIKTNVKMVY